MKLSKQITTLIICLAVLIGSLFIANQSALADFKQGTVQRGRFNPTKIVLHRTFGEEGGYIQNKDLRRTSPLNQKVNVYDTHGKKMGTPRKILELVELIHTTITVKKLDITERY